MRELRNSLTPYGEQLFPLCAAQRRADAGAAAGRDLLEQEGRMAAQEVRRAQLAARWDRDRVALTAPVSVSPASCAFAASAATTAVPSPPPSRRGGSPRRPRRRAAGSGGARTPSVSISSRSLPGCGQTSFSSSPRRCTTSLPALGLMHTQSIAGMRRARCRCSRSRCGNLRHAAHRPAHRRPGASARRRSARRSGASRPSPNAPRPPRPAQLHRRSGRRRRRPCRRSRYRRSGTPRVARSFSRPDHRLQPAKRTNTARAPAFTPSPWRVRNISLTA